MKPQSKDQTELSELLKDKYWRCLACGRALTEKENLAIVVKTETKQVIIFIPKIVIAKCKCGLVTTVKEGSISFTM